MLIGVPSARLRIVSVQAARARTCPELILVGHRQRKDSGVVQCQRTILCAYPLDPTRLEVNQINAAT